MYQLGYLKTAARLLAPIKQHSYRKMRIALGHHVLDAGCGPGIDVIMLGRLVGEQGQVVGIDHDEEMLAEARQRALAAGLQERVRFEAGNATALPFANGRFDACRSERLFMHLDQADETLQEIIRVVKPGGYIVSTETDWASLSCCSDHIDTERRLVRHLTEKLLINGYAARRLYRQFKAAGLNDIELEIFPLHTTDLNLYLAMTMMPEVEQYALDAGIITPPELEAWRSELAQNQARNLFFASVNVIMVSARKP